MTFDEWWQKERNTLTAVNPSAKDGAMRAWNERGYKIKELQARIDALEAELKQFTECDGYNCCPLQPRLNKLEKAALTVYRRACKMSPLDNGWVQDVLYPLLEGE